MIINNYEKKKERKKSNTFISQISFYSLTRLKSERQAWFAPAAPLDGDHSDDRRLAADEVCEVAACSVRGAAVFMFIDGCGHVEICLQGSGPGHTAHVTSTLQGHINIGGRAGACGEKERDQMKFKTHSRLLTENVLKVLQLSS